MTWLHLPTEPLLTDENMDYLCGFRTRFSYLFASSLAKAVFHDSLKVSVEGLGE